jgi:rRNA maturation endonuclease Nob1
MDGEGHVGPHYGRNAAMVVAVMAAFLAIATFLSNEAVKEVITGETHRANASALLESNRVKIDIAEGNSTMLRVLGVGSGQASHAAAAADRHEARVVQELRPTDAHLYAEVQSHSRDTDHANTQHVDYELAEVGLQVGIVLASVSIIARRRWLLGAAGAAATAGVVLLLVGLLLV